MELRDEFNTITNHKYEDLSSDSDRELLCKAARYIDFLEAKIKPIESEMGEGAEREG